MLPRDLVYVGHMLDLATKAVSKADGLSREAYDADENLRLCILVPGAGIEPARRLRDPGF